MKSFEDYWNEFKDKHCKDHDILRTYSVVDLLEAFSAGFSSSMEHTSQMYKEYLEELPKMLAGEIRDKK